MKKKFIIIINNYYFALVLKEGSHWYLHSVLLPVQYADITPERETKAQRIDITCTLPLVTEVNCVNCYILGTQVPWVTHTSVIPSFCAVSASPLPAHQSQPSVALTLRRDVLAIQKCR